MEQLKDLLNLTTAIAPILAILVVAIIGCSAFYFLRNRQETANEAKKVGNPNSGEKPEIVVFLRPHAACVQCLMLCIENIGTRTAYNVQFGPLASAPFIRSSNIGNVKIFKENDFLRRGISCFGAGQKIELFLIRLVGDFPEELKQPLEISVTYKDSLNYTYKNGYKLDFSEFESLVEIESIKEQTISDLRSLLHVIQKNFSQVDESIEPPRTPQTSKSKDSEIPHEEEEECRQIDHNGQANLLTPELQQLVELYNASDDATLRQNHKHQVSISVSNDVELFNNPDKEALFQTKPNGSLVAYNIDSENSYAVVPFLGCVLQNDLYNSGAFRQVFKCPNFDSKRKYHMKVIRPAMFTLDPVNEKWTLQEMGELELTVHDN